MYIYVCMYSISMILLRVDKFSLVVVLFVIYFSQLVRLSIDYRVIRDSQNMVIFFVSILRFVFFYRLTRSCSRGVRYVDETAS